MNLKAAQALAELFEGFRSKPYLCPAGIPTIGFGSTYYPDGRKVTLKDTPVSVDEARVMLLEELDKCLRSVNRLCPSLKDEGTVNALVDFVYNLGAGRLQTSTLRRKINEGNFREAKKEILKWNRGGGKILRGLVLRREAECLLIRS